MIMTIAGKTKVANAHANGTPLPKITHIAFGIGGINLVNGLPKSLSGNEASLFQEVMRKEIKPTKVSNIEYNYIINIKNEYSEGTIQINEVGIYDAEGTLISIKTFSNKPLDATTSLEFKFNAVY